MREQSGVNSIVFYEDNGISVEYNSQGYITSLTSTGNTIEFTECSNEGSFEYECNPSSNNALLWDYLITGKIEDFGLSSDDKVNSLTTSIYGWKPKISLKNGQTLFFKDVFFAVVDDIDTSNSHVYVLELTPRNPSDNEPIFFE